MPNMPEELKKRLTTTTDASGTAKFESLPTGAFFSVTMGMPDGQPVVLQGSVQTGKPTEVKIPLDRTLSGRFYRRQSGNPIVGARVDLVGPGYHNFIPGGVTDSRGRFTISGLTAAGLQRYDQRVERSRLARRRHLTGSLNSAIRRGVGFRRETSAAIR